MIKRRKYFVHKPVQLRYMSLVAIPLVLLCGGLYYLIYYAIFNEMLIPEAVASTLLPAMKKVNMVLLFAAPLALLILLRKALIDSNRIIGPVPRLERQLDQILAGDHSVRLRVRQGDHLGPFVDKVNRAFDRLSNIQA